MAEGLSCAVGVEGCCGASGSEEAGCEELEAAGAVVRSWAASNAGDAAAHANRAKMTNERTKLLCGETVVWIPMDADIEFMYLFGLRFIEKLKIVQGASLAGLDDGNERIDYSI